MGSTQRYLRDVPAGAAAAIAHRQESVPASVWTFPSWAAPPAKARPSWYTIQARRILVADALMVVITLLVTYLANFGTRTAFVDWAFPGTPYVLVLIPMGVVWFVMLTFAESRQRQLMQGDIEEFRRVVSSTVQAFGIFAITAYLLQLQLSRMYFLIALPTGIALIAVGRSLCGALLHANRRRGEAMDNALIVGSAEGVARAVAELTTHPTAGLRVQAVALLDAPDSSEKALLAGIPRVRAAAVPDYARLPQVNAVVATTGVSPVDVRTLAWSLEDNDVRFIVVPSLVDVRGPRIHTTTVPGLTMLRVDLPQTSSPIYVLRRVVDIVFSSLVLVLLSPVLALFALAIRLDSPGPVLFTQQRIGLNGKPFTIHKFRTMVIGAENMVDQLIAQHGGRAQLFKLSDDPRVTRVGRFLRMTSLDELPQFWDVLRGPMSVVGPRPQVAKEVEEYEEHMLRRLLMKPGITGLWQVSGRNDLTLQESVRLDLYYVENWSIAGDVAIVLKTVKVMFDRNGAY